MYAISTPCPREIKAQLRRRLRGHPSSGASRDTTIPKLRPLPRAVQSLCLYFCFLFSLFFYFSFFLQGRGCFNPLQPPCLSLTPLAVGHIRPGRKTPARSNDRFPPFFFFFFFLIFYLFSFLLSFCPPLNDC